MAANDQLLQGTAAQAARTIARQDLNRWAKDRRRLYHRKDPDALHDFRVALRRLRSTLRAYRLYLNGPSKGLRRRLRRLADATNESRNLEVWRAWVAAQIATLTPRERRGVRWLLAHLRTRLESADARMRQRIRGSFARLHGELREALSPKGQPGSDGRQAPSAAAAVRRAIRGSASELERNLAVVHSMADRDAAHAARIAAKRLRYLLEPYGRALPDGTKLVARLRELQTLLGEVHDAHGFADELRRALEEASAARARRVSRDILPWPAVNESRDTGPPAGARWGLAVLARRLRAEGEDRFEDLRKQWPEGAVAELLAGLERISSARTKPNRGGRI